MVRLSVVILIHFVVMLGTVRLHAESIRTEFLFKNSPSKLVPGDVLEAEIKLWPIEEEELESFKYLKGKLLFNTYFIYDILGIRKSENNQDVVLIDLLIVIKKGSRTLSDAIVFHNHPIPITSPNLEIEQDISEDDKDYFLEQELKKSNRMMLVVSGVAGLVLIVVVVAWIVKRKNKSKTKKIRERELRKKYREKFQSAKTRGDFESIYAEKELWVSLLREETPAHVQFYTILNKYQYMSEWNQEQLIEVSESFDVIRRSFSN